MLMKQASVWEAQAPGVVLRLAEYVKVGLVETKREDSLQFCFGRPLHDSQSLLAYSPWVAVSQKWFWGEAEGPHQGNETQMVLAR